MADQPITQPKDFGDVVNFRDDGILWMLNRTVFHPRGFALGIDPEASELYLYGDGTEAWIYTLDEEGSTEQDLFQKFEAMLARRREMAASTKATYEENARREAAGEDPLPFYPPEGETDATPSA